MTLLLTVFAAVIATVVWYRRDTEDDMHVGLLCWMFWGASLMWLVDAVYEYIELGAEYFRPSLQDMLNDSFLGLSVIALAMVVWVIVLLIRDPKGKVRRSFYRNRVGKENS